MRILKVQIFTFVADKRFAAHCLTELPNVQDRPAECRSDGCATQRTMPFVQSPVKKNNSNSYYGFS
jgi:hypothetical protein